MGMPKYWETKISNVTIFFFWFLFFLLEKNNFNITIYKLTIHKDQNYS